MVIRCFEGIGQMARGELHKYIDGQPLISVGRKTPWDSPPLGWIEHSPSYVEFSAIHWRAKLQEYRKMAKNNREKKEVNKVEKCKCFDPNLDTTFTFFK
jgi:hypothetical protein